MLPTTLVFVFVWTLGAAQEPSSPPPADAFKPEPTWKPLGTDLWFDPQNRTLVLRTRVALRDGALEHLLCLRNTKEHEAILATSATPKLIHAGLLLTGVEPGHPVRFRPEFQPPEGPPIAIEVEWVENGKTHRAPARDWVKDEQTGRLLDKDWVFAGSEMVEDPISKKAFYAADEGDLITVANFPSSILDLPFASSANDAERNFVANTPRIPPRGTPVTVYLRPEKANPKSKQAEK